MNGDLEKRLSDHIEEGGRFQGKVLQWIENFDKNVQPKLVTKEFCDARRAGDRADEANTETTASKMNRRIWANRIWAVLISAALLVFGHWLGTNGDDASATTNETRDVPSSRVEPPR